MSGAPFLVTDAELTCRELVELVTAFLEGALSLADRSRFHAHVGGCPGCAAYVDQLRQLLRVTQSLGLRLDARPLDPATRASLLAAVRRPGTHRNGRGDRIR